MRHQNLERKQEINKDIYIRNMAIISHLHKVLHFVWLRKERRKIKNRRYVSMASSHTDQGRILKW